MEALPQRIGKYEVRGLLGRGGMGRVLDAWDPDLQRAVAIKLIDPKFVCEPRAVSRFRREARALAQLSSPHIVAIYACELEHDPPYFVLQRLEGQDLHDLLSKGRRLQPRQLRDAAWQCLQGLAAAHRAGIVHRDLKPSNVFLQRNGRYTLIDFGLATDGSEPLTAEGWVIGTKAYVAPERWRGAPATPASDLWSLGLTLCVAGSGQHPDACRRDQVDALLPQQSPAFRAWLRTLLEPDEQQRFPDAMAALAAFPEADAEATANDDFSPTVPQRPPAAPTSITATVRPAAAAERPAATTDGPRPLRFWITITLALWALAAVGITLTAWLMGTHAYHSHFESLRQRLAHIAAGAVPLVDPELHARLAQGGEPSPADAAALEALRARLAQYIAAFPDVENIYTMAERPDTAETGIVQFICDASPERDKNGDGLIGDDERRARLHEPYAARHLPGMLASFRVATPERTLIRDQWGVWLSASAPILLPDGRSAGLVGVDMSAEEIVALRDELIARALWLLALCLAATGALALLVARWLQRPLAELARGLQALAAGDYEVTLTLPKQREFAGLHLAFTRLRDELRQVAALRRSIDALVARAIIGRSAPSDEAAVHLAAHTAQRAAPAITRLVEAALQAGGLPAELQASGVILRFPAPNAAALPQDAAARLALEWLSAHQSLGPHCAIAEQPQLLPELLAVGQRSGHDLLITDRLYQPLRWGFVADRLVHPELGVLWSIKAAVSAATPAHAAASAQ